MPVLHLNEQYHQNQARLGAQGFGGGVLVKRETGVVSTFCTISARALWLCGDREEKLSRKEEQALLTV